MSALAKTQIAQSDQPVKLARARKPKAAVKAKAGLLDVIVATLEDAKAENIELIDLAGKSSIADHMVVATGRVDRHVAAIADQILTALKAKGFTAPRIEGTEANEWVLIDAGDVIVHVFKPDARSFYNIERLWSADRPRDGEMQAGAR
jgi:ribosome-associated protein